MILAALLDANFIYPAPAVTDIFKARWTADIHREWMEALMRNEPYRDRRAGPFLEWRPQHLSRDPC